MTAAPNPDVRLARANVMWGYVVEHLVFAMQAAWIEWKRGDGAEHAMVWIENTLDGPGSLDEIEASDTDAQAYFDRRMADLRQRQTEAEAKLNAAE